MQKKYQDQCYYANQRVSETKTDEFNMLLNFCSRLYDVAVDHSQTMKFPNFSLKQPSDKFYCIPVYFMLVDNSIHEGEWKKGGNSVASLMCWFLKN